MSPDGRDGVSGERWPTAVEVIHLAAPDVRLAQPVPAFGAEDGRAPSAAEADRPAGSAASGTCAIAATGADSATPGDVAPAGAAGAQAVPATGFPDSEFVSSRSGRALPGRAPAPTGCRVRDDERADAASGRPPVLIGTDPAPRAQGAAA